MDPPLKRAGAKGGKRKHTRSGGNGLSKANFKRLARRGGVKRVGAGVFETTESALRDFLRCVIKDAAVYCEHAKRITVTPMDVARSLKRQGRPLYGYGDPVAQEIASARRMRGHKRLREAKKPSADWPSAGCYERVRAALSNLLMCSLSCSMRSLESFLAGDSGQSPPPPRSEVEASLTVMLLATCAQPCRFGKVGGYGKLKGRRCRRRWRMKGLYSGRRALSTCSRDGILCQMPYFRT